MDFDRFDAIGLAPFIRVDRRVGSLFVGVFTLQRRLAEVAFDAEESIVSLRVLPETLTQPQRVKARRQHLKGFFGRVMSRTNCFTS